MQEKIVDQSLNPRSPQRQPWKLRLGLLGVALLASLALASVAVNYLVPKVPDRAQGITARVGWYLHHGQLLADARTLGAALQYLVRSDTETPTVPSSASPAVVRTAAPGSPKS